MIDEYKNTRQTIIIVSINQFTGMGSRVGSQYHYTNDYFINKNIRMKM